MTNLENRTAALIRKHLPNKPRLAIVLGSGFDGLLRSVEIVKEFSYRSLPGFPVPKVEGHSGKLLLARAESFHVLILCGRAHFYEGHSMAEITFPMRVLANLGVEAVLLTNAAGAINPQFQIGDLMCVSDHINFMGVNPLRDPAKFKRPCFVDLSETYDRQLIRLLRQAAEREKARVYVGIYIAVSGPTYETPAEIRAFAKLGGDAVGMSTVPEAIVAHQCGMRVAALSCMTNLAAGRSQKPITHEEVLAIGPTSRNKIGRLLGRFLKIYLSE